MNFSQNFVVQFKGLHNRDIVRKTGSYPEKMDTTPFSMGRLSAFTGSGNPVPGTTIFCIPSAPQSPLHTPQARLVFLNKKAVHEAVDD